MAKKKPLAPAASRDAEPALPPLDSPALAHLAPQLRPLAVRVETLTVDPHNARAHDDASLAAIAASLRAYGHLKPLVVNRATKTVIAGNGQLQAARRLLGWEWIAAVFVEHDPATAAGFAIADNRSAELSSWDEQALLALLETADLDEALHDALLLDQLTQELAEQPPADPVEDLDAAGGGTQAIADQYSLVVECADGAQQQSLWEELAGRGLKVRPLTI